MKQSVWNKRIPGLLVLFFLGASYFVVTALTGGKTSLFSRASPSTEPQNVRITNVTDTSFTISYQTAVGMIGSISYGAGKTPDTLALDDRDASKIATEHTLHYFTLKNLKAKSDYSFIILSGGDTYQNNGAPYSVTTGATVSLSKNSQTITGKVLFPSGGTGEAIVYLTSSGNETLSTLAKDDGTYSFDTSLMRIADATAYASLPLKTTLHILIQGPSDQATTDLSSATAQIVPPITIGNVYDFSQSLSPTEMASPSGTFTTTALEATKGKVTITAPSQGQAFNDQQPKFSGTAKPNSTVTITIHSNTPITTTVKTDSSGNWKFSPSTALDPGQHTLTITAPDATGKKQSATSTFYVYASGSQFLQPSGPPADTSVTPTVTQTPSVSPTVTNTPTPSTGPTPTTAVVTPTLTPATTPTPVQAGPTITPTSVLLGQISPTITPTTNPGLLNAGSNSAWLGGIVALIPVILGGMLIYLSKGVLR